MIFKRPRRVLLHMRIFALVLRQAFIDWRITRMEVRTKRLERRAERLLRREQMLERRLYGLE